MRILITSIVDLRKTAPNRLHHFILHNDWWKNCLKEKLQSFRLERVWGKVIKRLDRDKHAIE